MRGLWLAITLALLAVGGARAEEAVEIPYAPGANTAWRFEETRTRTNSSQPERDREGVSRSTLQIGAQTEDGFDASWTIDEVEAGGQIERGESLPQFIGAPLHIQLDFAGAPSNLVDWPGTLRRIMDAAAAIADVDNPAAFDAVERMMAAWTPAQAAQILLQTLSVASICQHTDLGVGALVEAETMVANPFGGEAIAAVERLELLDVDSAAHVARLRYSRSLDPESAARAIVAGLREMVRSAGNQADDVFAQMEEMALTHDTRAACEVDIRTGVTRAVTYDVRVGWGEIVQTDRRDIRIRRAD